MGSRHYDQDKDSTLYVGNLDERCTDPLVWELMLQAGPVVNVHLPKDRVTQAHQGYGFVEFASEEDADYAAKIMNQIRVFGKPIRVNKASADRRGGGDAAAGGVGGGQGVGAELFVGNLEGMVDEKVLFETFSRFGPLVAPPKVARDEATNLSKGYGFISYASFEASDDAIANMHGQYLSNKEISVQYAYKKDGKGERHGDAAERALAAQAKKHGVQVTIPAMPAALVMPQNTPSGPASMANGFPPQPYPPQQSGAPPGWPNGGAVRTPQPPPGYNYGPYQPPQPSYPTQQQQSPAPGGYGGFGMPPGGAGGYGAGAPPAPQRQFAASPATAAAAPPPPGLPARPPPSLAGYGGPPGMGAQPGAPPGMPPGMPQGGYNRQPPPGYQGQR